MGAAAQMQYLGDYQGKKCYWAKPGVFVTPGFVFWDPAIQRHTHIALNVIELLRDARQYVSDAGSDEDGEVKALSSQLLAEIDIVLKMNDPQDND